MDTVALAAAAGATPRGLGRRIDADLETYRSVWGGDPVGGGDNAAVPPGTRQVPMLFGGFAPAALARMARWGDGYIGASRPAELVAGSFEQARAAWQEHGRAGQPRLVAICYFALGHPDQGPPNVHDYYGFMGDAADMIAGAVRTTDDEVRQAVKDFGDMDADELVFNPATGNLDDVARLAEIVF